MRSISSLYHRRGTVVPLQSPFVASSTLALESAKLSTSRDTPRPSVAPDGIAKYLLRPSSPSVCLSVGRSDPHTHPPAQIPCTTTRLPATSPMNIFLKPACGFFQSGNVDSWCKRGECSENAAPDLKSVMRWRDRVYMSVMGRVDERALNNACDGVIEESIGIS